MEPEPTPATLTRRHSHGEGGALSRTGFAWAVFEWARNPYYILVVIYIFAPYFARDIIGADLLVALAPPDRSGEFFGLSAIAGTITVRMAQGKGAASDTQTPLDSSVPM